MPSPKYPLEDSISALRNHTGSGDVERCGFLFRTDVVNVLSRMIKSSNFGDEDDPLIEHASTVELSVNINTSDLSRFPVRASSSIDSTIFVNSLQFDD